MLSSALKWLTPGGRQRQGNPPVNEDAASGPSSPSHLRGGEQEPSPALPVDGDVPSRHSLRQDLFVLTINTTTMVILMMMPLIKQPRRTDVLSLFQKLCIPSWLLFPFLILQPIEKASGCVVTLVVGPLNFDIHRSKT